MAQESLPAAPLDVASGAVAEGQWGLAWRRFRRHRAAVVAALTLALIVALSALAPWIAPFPRDEPNLQTRFVPPLTVDQQGHVRVLGTDHLGRDLLTRLLYASRVSLTTALSAALLAEAIGIVLGLTSGHFGGAIDSGLMRLTELVAVFPLFLLLIILANILVRNEQILPIPAWAINPLAAALSVSPREARGVLLIILLLGLFGWPTTARLARGLALSIREQSYIEAARALGAGNRFTINRHLFPNALPALIVDFTLAVNLALVTEAGLSFLSFGIQEPTPTWGNMLAFAQAYMFQHPWLPLIPTLPILVCSLAVNYLGDGLRDALDPRQRG